jgi:hypothetical protein
MYKGYKIRYVIVFLLVSGMLFSGFPLDFLLAQKGKVVDNFYFGKTAEAAYHGKHLRTIEYVLGGNASGAAASDNASRTSNTLAYAGTTWNTATGTSGMKVVKIAGSGIVVKQAYLDVWFHSQTSADTTDIDLFMNLLNTGPNPGVNVPVNGANATIVSDSGGLNMTIKARGDVTALFGTQSDAQFNTGISLAAAVRHTGETRRLTSARLVITYEQDYSMVAHTETKTVRFPLDSDGSGDTGSMQAACAISATCDFSYYADMPDLAQNSDITDVFVEIHAQVNSSTASTITPVNRNNGVSGTSGPGYNWTDTLAGDNSIHLLWRPTVGGNDFNANTANQKIRITNGTVPINVLGGEIVVTYNFSTDAPNQTETISYFMKQQNATSGTTTSTDAVIPTYIANASTTVRNIWFKAHAAESEANTWILTGQVGSGTVRTQGYTVGGVNTFRAGKVATVIFDISQDVGSYTPSSTVSTDLDLETVWSSATGDAPIAAEAFITFVWGGNQGGTVTKTVSFGATPGGAETVASETLEIPLDISLPEQVTKTHRSTYTEIDFIHSQATNLTANAISHTYTNYVNGNSQSIVVPAEEGTTTSTEPYLLTMFQNVTATQFASSTGSIYWSERVFMLATTHNRADEKYASFKMNVTYDAALGGYVPTFNQSAYRLFTNDNSTSVGAPLAALNTSTTLAVASSTFRLRILLHVTTGIVPVQYRSFKLQFVGKGTGTCSAPSGGSPASYTDVTSTTAIAYNNNATPVDGADLTATTTDPTHGGDTVVNQTYEEANNFTNNQAQITTDQDGLWDFALKDYAAPPGTDYCFRVLLSDDTVLTTYDQYPEVVTYTSGGGGNASPTITAVTDSPDPVAAGAVVYFNVDWNDTDSTYAQMFLCKTNAITTSTLTCDGGQWCNSVLTNRDPESCFYQTSLSEASTTAYNYYTFACDNQSACSSGSSGNFTISEQEPTAPNELLTEDMPNAVNISSLNPRFSSVYNDPNISDVANKFCIQVNSQSNFSGTNLWYSDDGTCLTGSSMATTSQGSRSPDFAYVGTSLNLNKSVYYWRMWFWDQNGTKSATSTVAQFTMASGTDNVPQGVRVKGGVIKGNRLK